MGSAASPTAKKPPSRKEWSSKSSKPKQKVTRSKAIPNPKAPKVDSADSALSAATTVASQHLRIPTNLPLCIVDNGGWTVKFGLAPPPPSVDSAGVASEVGGCNDCEGDLAKNKSDNASRDGAADDDVIMSSMYNATARPPHQLAVLVGDEITTQMKNLGQLSWSHPLERGMICDGEAQLRVWARVLEASGVVPAAAPTTIAGGGGGLLATVAAARRVKSLAMKKAAGARQQEQMAHTSTNCAFFLLEPPFVPSVISEGVDCMLFREMGMARVARMVGPCMAAVKYLSYGLHSANDATTADNAMSKEWINDGTNCCCVVDSGHSFTHVVPTHGGEALVKAIRRLNVGGKVLTNLLKEAVTYRHWNMMDEYHIVNDVKEQLCFVSDSFCNEMHLACSIRKGFRPFDREYLLPDFVNTFRGSVRLPEPLQRKKNIEEMKEIKQALGRLQEEKDKREIEEEAQDLASIQAKEEQGGMFKDTLLNKQTYDISKPKRSRREKRSSKRKEKLESGSENDEDNGGNLGDSDSDSEEETDQQRLHRLKAMREQERKRREQESLDQQALAMSVERFAIPEVLFRPSDIGLDCGGIVEAIVESIDACDLEFRAAMYHNVLLVGGNAKIPGMKERIQSELRKVAPANYAVRVHLPSNCTSYIWEGAKQFSKQPDFQKHYSIDRISWEAMKKAGKNQHDIWGHKIYNTVISSVRS